MARPPAWWYLTELPQGRNAARAGELFQVRGGSSPAGTGSEVDTQRGVTLAVEAQDLTDREVPGAAEIGTFIEQAQDASPPQPTWQD